MQHTPRRPPGDNPSGSLPAQGSTPTAGLSQQQNSNDQTMENGSEAAAITAISTCRLPPFWRTKPDLWFVQAEAALHVNRVRGDDAKYNMVLSMLDTETLMDIEDIIRAPPAQDKFATLKDAILSRLTDSADRQLLKLFTQLELGDQKPSQLLRRMRALAGSRVPDDVLKVKWLDLLPVSAQRLLRILKTASLEELATMADEIIEATPGVAAVSGRALPTERQLTVAAAGLAQATSTPTFPHQDLHATELSSIRLVLAQLVALNREMLAKLETIPARGGNGGGHTPGHRSRFRSRSRSRSTGPNSAGRICSYHTRWGAQAMRCLQPCSFHKPSSEGN